ncbi:radical SAM/SPASM domain-containing protein [Clostridium butanoliproducens]|uniref:radical SAM/SPASM domain-containing protein n=1 Tax=Clostridium butanoliproducens TaxID=2991837 RepID=UPI002DD67CE6|nr:radical SAM protein [Clostridium butanoliproducens]
MNRKDIIKNVRLNISNVCNLKCSYCYANKGNHGKQANLMKPDLALKICQYIEDNYIEVEEISFFGGEPLLNIDVIEIICKYFSCKDIKFSMVTNLTLLDEKVINLINKYNIMITGSLDGPKDINYANRLTLDGEGTFDIISDNIKKLKIKNPKALKMIEATYTNQSYKKYSKRQLANFFYENYKVSNIMFGDVITDNKEIELPHKYIEYNMETLDEDINFLYECLINNKISFLDKCAVPLLILFTKKSSDNFCNAGIKTILIDDVGDIWPCQGYINREEYKMGNILYHNENNDFYYTQQKLKNIKKSNIEYCNECIANYWCDKCIAYTSLTDDKQKEYYDRYKCNYNKILTERVLDKLSNYIKSGDLILINKNLKKLIEVV